MTTTHLHQGLTGPRTCPRGRRTIPRGATALYAHYDGYRPAEFCQWPACPTQPANVPTFQLSDGASPMTRRSHPVNPKPEPGHNPVKGAHSDHP